jgi:insertion element IS1 protein InsB
VFLLARVASQENGGQQNGTPHHHGHGCGRPFVQGYAQYRIADDQRHLLARFLMARMAWRGICRAVGVTRKWFVGWLVQGCATVPAHLPVQPVSSTHDGLRQRLAGEAAALASFVPKKAHQQGVGSAREAKTRPSMAWPVGDRRHQSAEPRWAKSPPAYRQHATFYTDQSVVYAQGIPAAQHQASSKWARQTHHRERCNHPLRQRVSRLGRDALSFAKKLANHLGAMKLFICPYNLTRATA